METQIAKISDLKPVSFSDKREVKLNFGQSKLILLIKSKAEKGEIITRDDILDFYIEFIKGGEYYKTYGEKPHPDPKYTHMIPDFNNFKLHKWRDRYGIKNIAVSWFRTNLGSCIVKGKILAIPVIDIE